MSLDRRQLAAYAAPALPLAILGPPLYVFVPGLYADRLGLGLTAVAAALVGARAFDLVIDPLVGHLNDRLADTRLGRQALVATGTAILLVGATGLLRPGDTASAVELFAWSAVAFLGWTLVAIPQLAWNAELAPVPGGERDRINGVREGATVAGILVAGTIPLIAGGDGAVTTTLDGYLVVLWLLLPATVIAMLAVLRLPPHPARPSARPDWRALKAHPGLFRLLGIHLVNGTANGVPAALFFLFVTHVLEAPDRLGLFLGAYFLAGVAALPAWLWLAGRIGRRRAWVAAMLWAALAFAGAPFLDSGDTTAFLVICGASGLSLAAEMALPAALQSDVVEIGERSGAGYRPGMFFGLWGMATKLAAPLGVGLAFPLLALAGFDAGGDHPGQGLWARALLYGGAPVILKLIAAFLAWRLPITGAPEPRPERQGA